MTDGVAMVTGGGRGIGRAIVSELAGRGRPMAVLDIVQEDAEAAAALARDLGVAALGLAVDVTDRGAVADAVQEVTAKLGPVEALCNNAGVMDRMAPAHSVSFEEWDRVLAVNLSGPFAVCKAVLPGMLERGSGAIVNIASIAGITGGRAGAAYTASKHALIGLTRNIAWMYGDSGIRCNAICPGGIATDIMAGLEFERTEYTARVRSVSKLRPSPGQPAEIAAVTAFLLSPQASYMSGAIVPVDGGWTAA